MGLLGKPKKAKATAKNTRPETLISTEALLFELQCRNGISSFPIESHQEYQLKIDRSKASTGHGSALVLVCKGFL